MGKLDDLMEKMVAEMTGKLGMKKVDKKLLTAIGKSLGPSLYKADSAKVACSDPKELERIKREHSGDDDDEENGDFTTHHMGTETPEEVR